MRNLNEANAQLEIEIGNKPFFVFLCYVLLVWSGDAFDFLSYTLSVEQGTIISRIIILIIFIILYVLLKPNFRFPRINLEVVFWGGSAIILILGLFKAIIPDTSYDVFNYHLLNQVRGFKQNFLYNIAPGGIQTYAYSLPDHLFYPFRYLLGYRFGTLLNSLIMILIFLQIAQLLCMLCGCKMEELRDRCLCAFGQSWFPGILFQPYFWALIITCGHDIVLQTATYMVDVISIPLALEVLYVLLDNTRTISKINFYYIALLLGLFLSFKLTNIIYVVPLAIWTICKYKKVINIGPLLFGGIIGVLPISIYMAYAYIETANPMFPFYNAIFHSPYYPIQNFKDRRWGPSNLLETLLWPFYVAFKPSYRQSELPNAWPYGFAGVMMAAVYFIMHKQKEKAKSLKILACVFLLSFYFWAITTGHIRYFMLGFLFGGILLCAVVVESSWSRSKWLSSISLSFALLFVVSPIFVIQNDLKGIEWSWRELDANTYKNNLKAFVNGEHINQTQTSKIKSFVMNDRAFGSLAHLINPDVPIYYNHYVHNNISDDKLKSELLRQIDTVFTTYSNGVYDIFSFTESDIHGYINHLNEYGIYIKEIESLKNTYFLGNKNILLVKLGKCILGETNNIYFAGDTSVWDATITKQQTVFKGIVGLSHNYGRFQDEKQWLSMIIEDDVNRREYDIAPIEEGMYYNFSIPIDTHEFNGEVRVSFVWKDKDKNLMYDVSPCKMLILNPELVN